MIRPWEEIRQEYERRSESLPALRAMTELVENIQNSRLSRLYAWMSMHDLYVVQQPVSYPYDGPRLLISPRFDGTIELRFIDTPNKKKQWRRDVPEHLAFERVERFTDELRWFPREGI